MPRLTAGKKLAIAARRGKGKLPRIDEAQTGISSPKRLCIVLTPPHYYCHHPFAINYCMGRTMIECGQYCTIFPVSIPPVLIVTVLIVPVLTASVLIAPVLISLELITLVLLMLILIIAVLMMLGLLVFLWHLKEWLC